MSRNDRYFGLHFDFHAKPNQTHIGKYFDAAAYRKLLSEAKPDFMQCDTKGHEGITSYPTKVGNPAPQIDKDILKAIREITREYGVDLYAHHSGAWDGCATEKHKDWAAVKEDGSLSQVCSCFSPYCQELLGPQLCEIAEYGLDGAWIDGECWAQIPDYSEYAKKAYKLSFGKECPVKGDKDYGKFLQFLREGFFTYVKRYISLVKEKYPDFKITSNWMNTGFVPEKYDGTVDFISGDYEPNDSVNAARFDGRIICGMGADWDLMAWAFTPDDGVITRKSAVQLKQEAAACISLGGGVQLYNIQYDGAIQEFVIPQCREVGEFVRARKEYCYRASLVPQIAVIFSKQSYYSDDSAVFSRWTNDELLDLRGNLINVLDCGVSAEIVVSDNVHERIRSFPLIVVPDFRILEEEIAEELLSFVKDGGKLILSGPHIAERFNGVLGLSIKERGKGNVYLENEGALDGINADYLKTEENGNLKTIHYFYDKNIMNDSSRKYPAVAEKKFGKGKITVCFYRSGNSYLNHNVPALNKYMKGSVFGAFCPDLYRISEHSVDLVLTEKNGKRIIQVTNLSGEHSNIKYRYSEKIPAIENVELFYRHKKEKVKSVTRFPENKAVSFTEKEDGIIIKIDKLDLHCSLVINLLKTN